MHPDVLSLLLNTPAILMLLPTAVIVSMVVSVIIPLISSLLSKAKWPQEITGILTLVIAAVNGFFTEWQASGNQFDWRQALSLTLVSFLIAVLSHYGIWKGTTTSQKLLMYPAKTTSTKSE